MSKNHKWLKRICLALAAPVLLLVVVEAGLAALGLFPPVRLLQPTIHQGVEYVYTNPDFGQLFLPRRENPMPSPVWVTREKKPGVTRVVLLGESAAAGFPHPEFNLGRVLQAIWSERYPEQPLEVVNLTMVAVNSHILRLFAREAMGLKPDALVVYAGHNEAIGPYGPAQVFGRAYPWVWLARLNLWLRNTRVGRGVDAGYRLLRERRGQAMPRWVGLEEFRDRPVPPDHPRLDTMARQARINFGDIATRAQRDGVPVLLCLPAVNLTDWPPLGSLPQELDDETVLSAWLRGDAGPAVSAWQVYRLARQRAAVGDWPSAWPLYRRASDTDLYRFSADSRIRAALADVGRRFPSNRVVVADADQMLHEANPRFRTDRDYFYEHVHLTFAGRVKVAGLMVDRLARLFGKPETGAAGNVQMEDVAQQLLYTPWDEYDSWQNIWALLSLGVFARQPGKEDREHFISETTLRLREQLSREWDENRLTLAYREAQARLPDDPVVDFIAGCLYIGLSSFELAERALRRGLARWPNYPEAYLNLARVLLARADFTGMEQALEQAARYAPQHPRLPLLRGTLYARTGRLVEARDALELVVSAQPRLHNAMVNLGNVYLLLGEDAKALAMFSRCLEIEPVDAYVLRVYAWLSASSDQATPAQRKQALGYARQAVALKPQDYRARSSLALALAASGDQAAARREAGQVIAAAQAAGDESTLTNLVAELARHRVAVE